MADATTPISPARYASALPSLPDDALFGEHQRLTLALSHLHRSNAELGAGEWADDPVCRQAVEDNRGVIARFEAFVGMVEGEMGKRGLRREGGEEGKANGVNGVVAGGDGTGGEAVGEGLILSPSSGDGSGAGDTGHERTLPAQEGGASDESVRPPNVTRRTDVTIRDRPGDGAEGNRNAQGTSIASNSEGDSGGPAAEEEGVYL